MQIANVSLTCVVSGGIAYLFCDDRVVWTGEPGAVRLTDFSKAAKCVQDIESLREISRKNSAQSEERRAWKTAFKRMRANLGYDVIYKETRDEWKIKLESISRSLAFRKRACAANIKFRKRLGTKRRSVDCSWERALLLAIRGLERRVKYRADVWGKWANNKASNIRKRMLAKLSGLGGRYVTACQRYPNPGVESQMESSSGTNRGAELQMRLEWGNIDSANS